MKLEDVRKTYYELSGKTSDIVRQLGFAGIAIIWVFKNEATSESGLLPREFLWPGVFVVAALGFDLMQYVSGSLMWSTFARNLEKQNVGENADVDAPSWTNWPALFFFWGKVLLIIVAYVLLGRVLLVRLF